MIRESQIDSLASFLVHSLAVRQIIKPKAEEKDLIACVVELMSANFETEAEIDAEADRMTEQLARQDPRADPARLRSMIRQRLAEKKGFTL